jgi:hypothetical protein
MSFYNRNSGMGFVWLAPVVELVGGAMKSQPISGQFIEPTAPTSPLVIAAGALGGLLIVGGLIYLAMPKKGRGR